MEAVFLGMAQEKACLLVRSLSGRTSNLANAEQLETASINLISPLILSKKPRPLLYKRSHERMLKMQFVDSAHEIQVGCRQWSGSIIETASTYSNQLSLFFNERGWLEPAIYFPAKISGVKVDTISGWNPATDLFFLPFLFPFLKPDAYQVDFLIFFPLSFLFILAVRQARLSIRGGANETGHLSLRLLQADSAKKRRLPTDLSTNRRSFSWRGKAIEKGHKRKKQSDKTIEEVRSRTIPRCSGPSCSRCGGF